MNYIIKNLQNSKKYQDIINTNKNPVTISGLVSVAKPMVISAIKTEERKPILIITYNEIEAKDIIKNLGGLDKTKGSCSSVALAYVGNKGGYNGGYKYFSCR